VPSALIGGIGAIAVTALWLWWFPDLKRIGSLEPEPVLERDAPTEPREAAGKAG